MKTEYLLHYTHQEEARSVVTWRMVGGGWGQLLGLQLGGRNDLDRIVLRQICKATNQPCRFRDMLVEYSLRLNRPLYRSFRKTITVNLSQAGISSFYKSSVFPLLV